MAVEIRKKFSVDLSVTINDSISAVRQIRNLEQARKEAEFQRAIANGLSYEEQIKLRESQLAEDKKSNLSEKSYIEFLEKSIADIKKLNRFNKYRTKYSQSLAELSAGKINENKYLSILKKQLNGVTSPELRLEIEGDIADAQTKLKLYNDTILSNQVKKAKYDGTVKALNDVISRVTNARIQSLINDAQDDVTAYDETLSALNSQLSTVRIQDSITDFQVKSSTRGTDAMEKLEYINSQLNSSDSLVPIKIGDRTFSSAQQFWTLERDNYINGSSQVFGNFFEELDNFISSKIGVSISKFGYPTQAVLDEAMFTFNELKTKPEMTPFLGRLDIAQASVMTDAVDKYAKHLITVTQGTTDFSFKQADAEIQKVGIRYGVDVTANRVSLQNLSLIDEDIPISAVPELDLKLPKVEDKPVAPDAGAPPTSPPGTPRIVKSGDTLGAIARESGISLLKLLELNPQFKSNPNLIAPGQSITLPGAETTPPTPEAPIVKEEAPAVPSVTPSVTPPASQYTGSSIVDYLKSVGQDSSTQNRAKLAVERGIVKSEDEYFQAAKAGTNAILNTNLLDSLRKQQ